VRELKRQFAGGLIVILTIAAVIAAGINFQQQRKFRLPEDGVTWVDREGKAGTTPGGQPIIRNNVVALHVVKGGPADRAGVVEGDILRRVESVGVTTAAEVAEILVGMGVWKKVDYFVERPYKRDGVEILLELRSTVYVAEHAPSDAVYYQYFVGAAYLFVGLFVFFRRGDAHKALHFYLLCLASFVLYTFHYTGKLNSFDQVIYFGNVFAGLLMPTLFIHFALVFPEPPPWLRGWVRPALLYVPAVVGGLLWMAVVSGTLRVAISPIELRWMFDRVWLGFLAGGQLAGAGLLSWRYRRTRDAIMRQQIKWLRNGAVFGVLPFAALYVLPYLAGAVLGPAMEMAVLPLMLVPVTWAYAIFRYRLMDVDIIFQQGYVYTLATLAVLAVFYGLVFSITASIPHPEGQPGAKVDDLNPAALVSLILIAAFIFQPVRNWLQEVLDRHFFYKDRYDYRRTLIEFARELGSETDLNRTLNAVADRLTRTLSIERIAFFLNDEKKGGFRLYMTAGLQRPVPDLVDLAFLPETSNQYLFFERTRGPYDAFLADQPQTVRHTIADLDLTYYVPCTARGRVIAYLGASRTTEGDFLSSDDVELLQTLCGYVGISIENARLYRSLARKAEEYERLKEFSENIVESINVGIAAADFEDRVESWNSQMEQLTGIRREDAVGRPLRDLLPEDLVGQLGRLRSEEGIHTIYKFPLPGPDDSDRVINVVFAPLVSKEQEQIGRLILFDDITERSVLENRLVQADKLSSLGLLAAGVAHEVNTPLAVISSYAQLLAKQVSGDESKSKLLEKIAKQTFRASEIVNSLLNFSRTSSTAYEEVDLNRILRETLQLIHPQLEKAKVRVEERLDGGVGMVRGNAGKLQQVFLNLLLNARDAMEGGGTLIVETAANDKMARVAITDSGCGIPEENLARIYDPFFTTKGAKKGTGLGLSITYGIVKEHGGSIGVLSQVGQGTCFQLDFPLVRKPVNA
jgi:two-component system, NtrC family, sensor kinase